MKLLKNSPADTVSIFKRYIEWRRYAIKKRDDSIQLSKEQKSAAVAKIKEYIEGNFETEIGALQAGIFVDFITESIGSYYYNKGVLDSLHLMSEKTEDLYLLMKDEE